jgi:hypothetical protein
MGGKGRLGLVYGMSIWNHMLSFFQRIMLSKVVSACIMIISN